MTLLVYQTTQSVSEILGQLQRVLQIKTNRKVHTKIKPEMSGF
jgi:hypothetical protein